jgi:hypothetical protein
VIGAALIALVSGAFGLGLTQGHRRLADAEGRQEFHIKYLRYLINQQMTRDDLPRDPTESQRRMTAYQEATNDFSRLVYDLKSRHRAFDGNIQLEYHFDKTDYDPAKCRLKFSGGEEWPIPRKIKEAVLSRERQATTVP